MEDDPILKAGGHGHTDPASSWVVRFAPLVRSGGSVLDVAAGHGRHARLFTASGHAVTAVDRHPGALAALRGIPGVAVIEADIEAGPWPFAGRTFDAVVVTNYLWRPLLGDLAQAIGAGGVLIYETFRIGNEAHGKPSNPDFLLRAGELLEFAHAAGLAVVAFESGRVDLPRPAVVERICARRDGPGTLPALLRQGAPG